MKWEENYEKLKGYYHTLGKSWLTPEDTEDDLLISWIRNQRRDYKNGVMPLQRIQKLNAIEFVWDMYEMQWNEMFEALVLYKEEHGDCLVPQQYLENPYLGEWVITQRCKYKKRTMSPERIEKLNAIGFTWVVYDAIFEEMYAALLQYQRIHGHCRVSYKDREYPRLNSWVSKVRLQYQKQTLAPERIEKLNAIGFTWSVHQEDWEAKFQELSEYKQQFGHCCVPRTTGEHQSLGEWVNNQRMAYRKGRLVQEKVDRLNEVGFVWSFKKKMSQ